MRLMNSFAVANATAGQFFRGSSLGLFLVVGIAAPASAVPITSEQVGVSVDPKANPELEQAVAEFNQKHFDVALDLLNKASAKNPELPPGRTTLAQFFIQTNQLPAARAMLEQTVIELPDDPEAFRIFGDIAFQERRLTEARLLFEELGRMADKFAGNPKRKSNYVSASHAGLAAVAEALQNWELAHKHLTAWLAIDAKNAGAHHRMGQALFGLEKPDEAYQELQTAASMVAELPVPEVTMGRLYQQSGKSDKAAEWMNKAIEKFPDSLPARLGVAQWQFENGKLDDAQKNLEAALKLKADSLEAQVLSGIVYRFQKNYPAAEQHLQAAYLASPSNAMAANQLALVLSAQPDEAKRRRALELAEGNSREFANNPEIAATLGWICFQNGRVDDAAKIFKAVANSGRVSPDTAYFMAVLSNEAGKGADAMPALRSAIDSKSPFAYRDEAKKLLAEIEASAGTATATDADPAVTKPAAQAPAAATKPAAGPAKPATKPAAGSKAPPATKPAAGSKAPPRAPAAPGKANAS